MRRMAVLAGLGVLLIFSGCLGFAGDPADETVTPTAASTTVAPTSTPTPTPTPTETGPTETYTIVTPTPEPTEPPETYTTFTATAEPTPTPEPVYEIPVWANDSTADSVDEGGIVRDAMAYWEGEGDQYYGFEAEFHMDDSRYNGGMSVFFVEDVYDHVQQCGTTAIGCIVPQESGTWAVYIEPCEERENTLSIVKHEFGHYLGFEHGDEPKPLMDPVTLSCS